MAEGAEAEFEPRSAPPTRLDRPAGCPL